MSRQSFSRRHVLFATSTALVGLTGCSALGSSGEETEETTATTTRTTTEQPTSTETTTRTTEDEATTPTNLGSIHFHGTLILEINGQAYRFGDKQRNTEEDTGNKYFHFHDDGAPNRWHVHAENVTLGYGVGTMPKLELTATAVTYNGQTYADDDAGTDVSVTVNGEELDDVASYVLQPEDQIRITVETDKPAPTTEGTGTSAMNGTNP